MAVTINRSRYFALLGNKQFISVTIFRILVVTKFNTNPRDPSIRSRLDHAWIIDLTIARYCMLICTRTWLLMLYFYTIRRFMLFYGAIGCLGFVHSPRASVFLDESGVELFRALQGWMWNHSVYFCIFLLAIHRAWRMSAQVESLQLNVEHLKKQSEMERIKVSEASKEYVK